MRIHSILASVCCCSIAVFFFARILPIKQSILHKQQQQNIMEKTSINFKSTYGIKLALFFARNFAVYANEKAKIIEFLKMTIFINKAISKIGEEESHHPKMYDEHHRNSWQVRQLTISTIHMHLIILFAVALVSFVLFSLSCRLQCVPVVYVFCTIPDKCYVICTKRNYNKLEKEAQKNQ